MIGFQANTLKETILSLNNSTWTFYEEKNRPDCPVSGQTQKSMVIQRWKKKQFFPETIIFFKTFWEKKGFFSRYVESLLLSRLRAKLNEAYEMSFVTITRIKQLYNAKPVCFNFSLS